MSTDAKILNKILATRIHNTLKRSYTMTKWVYPRDARILQYPQIDQCNTPQIENVNTLTN